MGMLSVFKLSVLRVVSFAKYHSTPNAQAEYFMLKAVRASAIFKVPHVS
jgi:hypothetical protein